MEQIKQGDFGPVLITKGKNKGDVGYYDDDRDLSYALVYLAGMPTLGKATLIRRCHLIPVNTYCPIEAIVYRRKNDQV